eukprot:TRINITY_DN23462_c0_g1_i1.p1 TRINITY_DN23462_c0_g1~~TRINITY_DN23462_c0_g1_i1.p1  ORF type:complete len:579 (-),score=99.98 TRINITY_DN23462_c0_g1_i1:7-1743(-)
MKMRSMHAVVALAALTELIAAVRDQKQIRALQQEASSVSTSTSIDVWVCDKMCMQCPDGRNILVQRQKSGKANVVGGVAGALSFGWGMTAVTQLAGCSKIGFEFWEDRTLSDKQPLRTVAFMGVLWVRSGLEKLKEATGLNDHDDLKALEACDRLTDTYAWSALRGALSGESSNTVQERYARDCLAHSKLCGPGGVDNATLQAGRWNPFTHESMCKSQPEKDIEQVTNEDIKAWGAKLGVAQRELDDLLAQSPEVQRIVMLKWPEEGSTSSDGFVKFVRDVMEVVAQIPTFVDAWNLDGECAEELSQLPIKLQKTVLREFTTENDNVKTSFLSFLKSQFAAEVASEVSEKFIESSGLNKECLEAMKSQPLGIQKSVMMNFHPASGVSDINKAFLDYLALAASVESQIFEFASTWNLDGECLEELSIQPPEVKKYVIENFKPDSSSTVNDITTLKALIKSVPKTIEEVGEEDQASVQQKEESIAADTGRHFVKQAPSDAEVIVKEAGESLEKFVLEKNPHGDFTLADEEIGRTLHTFCSKKCKGDQEAAVCKDGCCWKTCTTYKNTPGPKCTMKCVNGK